MARRKKDPNDARGEDWNWVEGAVDNFGGIKASAEALGVDEATLIKWMKKGSLPEPLAKQVGETLKCWWPLLYLGRDYNVMPSAWFKNHCGEESGEKRGAEK